MNLTKNIEIIDLALYLKKENILIIADIHIGYEEALNKQGIFVPRFQFKEIILRLEKILKKINKEKNKETINNKTINKKIKKLNKIIVNGDIKHEFGTISNQEWRHTLQLLDFLSKYCNEIILIKGNHDTIIGPIAEKRKVKVVDSYIINSNESVPSDSEADKANLIFKKNNLMEKINENHLLKKSIKTKNKKIIKY